MSSKKIIEDQTIAAVVQEQVNQHTETLKEQAMEQLKRQDMIFEFAKEQHDKVRDFVANPENILGSAATKHGEVAEQIEVAVRNAKEIMEKGLSKDDVSSLGATFEGVGRTAPEDYIINDIAVQSKYINGINNNLSHVLDHLEKYKNIEFGRDGSFYHIPKDHYEEIMKIKNNIDTEEFSDKTVKAVLDKISRIEKETGLDFDSVVQPGECKYNEVQLMKANETMDTKDAAIKDLNDEKVKQINSDSEYKANLGDGLQAGAIGAAVAGTIDLAMFLYQKKKEGKSLFDFTEEDFKECGLSVGKASVVGGVSSMAIYGLTTQFEVAAPLAGAAVSFVKSSGSLFIKYKNGEISKGELIDSMGVLSVETTFITAGSMIGQALIPVPVLGAMLGSISGKIVLESLKMLGAADRELEAEIKRQEARRFKELTENEQKIWLEFKAKIDHLKILTEYAFDFKNNKMVLESSVALAQAYEVPEEKILKTISDVDDFMLG